MWCKQCRITLRNALDLLETHQYLWKIQYNSQLLWFKRFKTTIPNSMPASPLKKHGQIAGSPPNPQSILPRSPNASSGSVVLRSQHHWKTWDEIYHNSWISMIIVGENSITMSYYVLPWFSQQNSRQNWCSSPSPPSPNCDTTQDQCSLGSVRFVCENSAILFSGEALSLSFVNLQIVLFLSYSNSPK